MGSSWLNQDGSEQRWGAKLCWDLKEPWRSTSEGDFLVAAASAFENEDEGVKKGQMPIQGPNSTHQWVFLAENRHGRSVLNRTVKVSVHPPPAFQIHVTRDSNYAYRKIRKLTTDRHAIPTLSLRLSVPTFSPFRTVQLLQSVPEHGSCHGCADG